MSLQRLIYPLFMIALSFALHGRALGVGFSLDDLLFLMRAEGLEEWPLTIRRLLSVRLFFTAGWKMLGDNAAAWHLIILTLHGINGGLLSAVGRRLGLSDLAARIAGFLFVVSPVAFTALHWISGVQEVLAAFFSLLAVLALLRDGRFAPLWFLPLFLLALLCKESVLLLPLALGVALSPLRRQRLQILAGGLILGAVIFRFAVSSGAGGSGGAYETAFGLNILWNLLTYDAWLVRLWNHFPDFRPQYDQGLWAWGLILPAILAATALLAKKARRPILKAAAAFLLLLLPVLPLVRHSYFYYLMIPLAPLWLLAAGGLSALGRRHELLAWWLPLLILATSAWQGAERRSDSFESGLLKDPVLRYGGFVEKARQCLEDDPELKKGDLLIIAPFLGETTKLAEGVRATSGSQHVQFLPVARALRGGKALRLFFPGLRRVAFAERIPTGDRWRSQHLFWTWGEGGLTRLGYGDQGRWALARLFFKYSDWQRAAAELEALVAIYPHDPDLLYDLGAVALASGDRKRAAEIRAKLESQVEAGGPGAEALNLLRKKAEGP